MHHLLSPYEEPGSITVWGRLSHKNDARLPAACITAEALRFVVVHARQRAQQQTQTYAVAHAQDAEAVTDHAKRVQAQWFACLPAAEAALAAYEGKSRAEEVAAHASGAIMRSAIALWPTPAARAVPVGDVPPRRPRPRPSPGYRLVVEVETLAHAEADKGWTVLATTVDAQACPDVDILQA